MLLAEGGGPSFKCAGALAKSKQAAPKAAQKVSGNAADFRAAVAPGIKAMKDAAAALNIA